jgi:hypothetical protein
MKFKCHLKETTEYEVQRSYEAISLHYITDESFSTVAKHFTLTQSRKIASGMQQQS